MTDELYRCRACDTLHETFYEACVCCGLDCPAVLSFEQESWKKRHYCPVCGAEHKYWIEARNCCYKEPKRKKEKKAQEQETEFYVYQDYFDQMLKKAKVSSEIRERAKKKIEEIRGNADLGASEAISKMLLIEDALRVIASRENASKASGDTYTDSVFCDTGPRCLRSDLYDNNGEKIIDPRFMVDPEECTSMWAPGTDFDSEKWKKIAEKIKAEDKAEREARRWTSNSHSFLFVDTKEMV